MTQAQPPVAPFDRRRYLRVVAYLARTFAGFIWWEILLRRLLGRRFVSRSAAQRWQRIARRYRALAVDLGGVLIKLGQFLSARVDVLPAEFTAELAGLQDEVPAETAADIQAVVEAEFGRPVDQVFGWFAPQPEAAASLAQVHSARLPGGDPVVVKVQRPGINTLVETDLRAIRTAARWLKRYRPVSRRVDLDRLYDEFSRTTRNELDFVAEGHNAERFAQDFDRDPGIRIPRVYWETTTRRVLTMQNVAAIKIGDHAAIDAAGIDRAQVAQRLFDTYMQQVFVHNFVHADPHPGNLFVEPLEPVEGRSRPFILTFVDFGMVAVVPERARKHLRDFLVGFATKDTARMVRAYQGAGLLLPGADLARLEEVQDELFDRYWGITMSQAREIMADQWQNLAREYRDLLYEMPFQIPTDLLFVGRAVAILSGMATALDPDFDPWQAISPFAEQLAKEELGRDWRGWLAEISGVVRVLLSLPGQADRFFAQANQGKLAVRASLAPDAARSLHRVEVAVNRLAAAAVFAALLLAAVAVYITQGMGAMAYALLALASVALLVMLTRR
ncbi:MAG: AarF/ABC1/UbiB kinase family protein [Anaerolineae bacterium]|nr:AarF/ABC1/UbiB kinase family protein [Anaerolineae bacterium]